VTAGRLCRDSSKNEKSSSTGSGAITTLHDSISARHTRTSHELGSSSSTSGRRAAHHTGRAASPSRGRTSVHPHQAPRPGRGRASDDRRLPSRLGSPR
jgi:hypothetical protein